MQISDFWKPFEEEISSFKGLIDVITRIMTLTEEKKLRFAWRGQVDADWALHSSLYRRCYLTKGKPLNETAFFKEEERILADLHRWGLHYQRRSGRLSVLNQLAMLQHHGAPTRLIDVSFNAWIAVWFAVEEKMGKCRKSTRKQRCKIVCH
jgi:FRG domain